MDRRNCYDGQALEGSASFATETVGCMKNHNIQWRLQCHWLQKQQGRGEYRFSVSLLGNCLRLLDTQITDHLAYCDVAPQKETVALICLSTYNDNIILIASLA